MRQLGRIAVYFSSFGVMFRQLTAFCRGGHTVSLCCESKSLSNISKNGCDIRELCGLVKMVKITTVTQTVQNVQKYANIIFCFRNIHFIKTCAILVQVQSTTSVQPVIVILCNNMQVYCKSLDILPAALQGGQSGPYRYRVFLLIMEPSPSSLTQETCKQPPEVEVLFSWYFPLIKICPNSSQPEGKPPLHISVLHRPEGRDVLVR